MCIRDSRRGARGVRPPVAQDGDAAVVGRGGGFAGRFGPRNREQSHPLPSRRAAGVHMRAERLGASVAHHRAEKMCIRDRGSPAPTGMRSSVSRTRPSRASRTSEKHSAGASISMETPAATASCLLYTSRCV